MDRKELNDSQVKLFLVNSMITSATLASTTTKMTITCLLVQVCIN